jgi:hypothetical protein
MEGKKVCNVGEKKLLGFLGTLSSFQPSPGESHEDLGMDFILEATYKEFSEKIIRHYLCSKK